MPIGVLKPLRNERVAELPGSSDFVNRWRKQIYPLKGWWAAASLAYVAGLAWRFYYLFVFHRAENFIYSDMGGYYQAARLYFTAGFHSTITDSLSPPGTAYFFGFLLNGTNDWSAVYAAQWFFSALIPLLIAGIGNQVYGLRVALLALVISSLYFPFIDYAGFILSENLFIFCLLAAMYFLVRALRQNSRRNSVLLAVGSGFFWAAAASFKTHGIIIAFALCFFGFCVQTKNRRATASLFLVTALATAFFIVPLVIRATRLNDSKFLLIANNGIFNSYLALIPDALGGTFVDPKSKRQFSYSSPSRFQRGYTKMVNVPAAPYDKAAITKLLWKSAKTYPVDTALLAFENFLDLFVTLPWPSCENSQKRWVRLFQEIFWIGILLPSVNFVWRRRKSLWDFRNERTPPEWVLVLPILIMSLLSTVTGSEVRYRIPFDGFFILLAAASYFSVTTKPQKPKLSVE
jgi:4-amino-4-deoxy-L-arabinose transferase-like glycosyltransferase